MQYLFRCIEEKTPCAYKESLIVIFNLITVQDGQFLTYIRDNFVNPKKLDNSLTAQTYENDLKELQNKLANAFL